MKLSAKATIIAKEKLRDYLLNFSNPEGESKGRFLGELGYERNNWKILEKDLREQHLSIEASRGKESLYGKSLPRLLVLMETVDGLNPFG